MSKFFPLLFIGAQISILSSGLDAMPLFKDGKEQAIVVVGDQAPPTTLYAAKELVRHLDGATKGHFAIKKEAELLPNDPRYRIYVGASEGVDRKGINGASLKKNHYVVFPAKEALFLLGHDDKEGELPVDDAASMGSLLAVYHWLDRDLGVRWLWPGIGGTQLPAYSELETKEGPPVYGKPPFDHSDLRFFARYYVPGKPSRYGRSDNLLDRSFVIGSEWLRRQKVVRTTGNQTYYGHGFGDYWKRYGETNPEFFALRPDGMRGPVDERTYLTQMCVSNPELHKVIIQNWLETRTPERPWINGCENDRRAIDPFCYCPACKAWDVPSAKVSVPKNPWHIDSRTPDKIDPYESVSVSDRYARFLLALLEEGKKHDPKAKVIGYAYSFYSDPPVETKLNDDVIIIVVPPYVYPLDKGKEDQVRKLWDGWKATGARLSYRPNDFLLGYAVPYIYPTQFGRDFKYFFENGMISTDFDSMTAMWGTQGVNLYLLGRLHARPELSVDEVLDEYYSAFGAAKESIKKYISYWEEITARCNNQFHAEVNGGWAVMMRAAHRVYTPEVFAEGFAILKKAAVEAANEPESLQRVRYLEVWLEHAVLCTKAAEVFRSLNHDQLTQADRDRFNKELYALRDFRAKHEDYLEGANWAFLQRWEPWRLWVERE